MVKDRLKQQFIEIGRVEQALGEAWAGEFTGAALQSLITTYFPDAARHKTDPQQFKSYVESITDDGDRIFEAVKKFMRDGAEHALMLQKTFEGFNPIMTFNEAAKSMIQDHLFKHIERVASAYGIEPSQENLQALIDAGSVSTSLTPDEAVERIARLNMIMVENSLRLAECCTTTYGIRLARIALMNDEADVSAELALQKKKIEKAFADLSQKLGHAATILSAKNVNDHTFN